MLGGESMTEMIFQILLLTGVWLGVVLLNAVRKCVEALRDSQIESRIEEINGTLSSLESRVEALANDYHRIHPALRNVDDEIY
jgi:outer membrane murein-binding lipoprotein Lpp